MHLIAFGIIGTLFVLAIYFGEARRPENRIGENRMTDFKDPPHGPSFDQGVRPRRCIRGEQGLGYVIMLANDHRRGEPLSRPGRIGRHIAKSATKTRGTPAIEGEILMTDTAVSQLTRREPSPATSPAFTVHPQESLIEGRLAVGDRHRRIAATRARSSTTPSPRS